MKDLVLGLLSISIFLFIFLGLPILLIAYGGTIGMFLGIAWLIILTGGISSR